MKKVLWLTFLCLASLAVLAGGAWGEDICVDLSGGPGVYSTDLQAALSYAATNGESDVIKVAQGVYQDNFIYAQSLGHDITLEGGYVPGTSCAQREVDPSNTILDGLVTGRTLYLSDDAGGSIVVDGVTIQNGNSSGNGGGFYAWSSASGSGTAGNVTITNNIIKRNTSAGEGGGVYARSYSTDGTAGTVILFNNIITENNADTGGGVFASSFSVNGTPGTVTVTNNTITRNSAGSQGGGVNLYAYSFALTGGILNCYNNIIWGNTSPTAADIYVTDTEDSTTKGYNNDYDFSAMFGGWDLSADNKDDVDPKFIDPDHGDFRLQSGSTCKDAGLNSAPQCPTTDFEGDSRPIDTTVDIGADECSVVTTCVSDASGLFTALDNAGGTAGKGDVIMVQQGLYTRSGNFECSTPENITLLGGYNSGCTSRAIDPAGTVLQGDGTGTVLNLSSGGSDIRVDGFTIQNGLGAIDGGGVRASSTTASDPAGDITLANNIVTGNTASNSGGGVSVYSATTGGGAAGDVTLVNNTVAGNTATGTGAGGGVHAASYTESGGAVGTITCTNNTVTGNGADYGGGINLLSYGTPGGFILAYNNIIWGNTATSEGGDVYLAKGSNIANAYNNDAHDVAGDGWDNGEETNIDLDPLFVGGGVYRLRPDSPCIDQGTNDAPGLPGTDFEDDQRMLDGDHNGIPFADIGADEYSGLLPPCDYDADGHTDIGVYRPSTGAWYLNRSTLGSQTVYWGGNVNDVPIPEDFDGDGESDITVYRSTTGWWYVKGVGNYLFGGSGYIPIPADYDGDGAIDLGVYTSSTGWWYVKGVGNYLFGGLADDIPVPGDYDGDGNIDVAVYRSSTGWWYVKGVGQFLFGGLADDIPVPGDYDGDGITDIALFRPSTGWWYIKDVGSYLHGASGDIPVPGDYDRDGVTEIAVFRPSNGRWYIRGASTFPIWGQSGDIPLTRNIWIWQETGLLP